MTIALATSRLLVSKKLILLSLALVALIPRILLATQLDLVTDEDIYIAGGKIYFPLILHLRIASDQWNFNYEHPPFVKLLIGLMIYLNAHLGHLFSELLAARIPSIIFGTLLVIAIYGLGSAPFGRAIALLAALCLAVSPWLVYFSALAYLDMTMTTLITIAYFLLWFAPGNPRLYLFSAVLVGLGAASKYTAVLAIPGMVLFTAYYFLAIRPRLAAGQRPPVPWRWWIAALVLAPITFFLADPAIWRQPLGLLLRSFRFEWDLSQQGHLTFLAGQYSLHIPHWTLLYIILIKLSGFVTVPAAYFVIFALIQLFRFHFRKSSIHAIEAASIAFLFIWLLSLLSVFSLLNIVVGTHYVLPCAPAVALAGAFGWATLLHYRRGIFFFSPGANTPTPPAGEAGSLAVPNRTCINFRAVVVLATLTVFLIGPHLVGLITVFEAEGYTSEFFNGENGVLQVAYPAYREAGRWLLAHTQTPGRVGLVAIIGTLDIGIENVSWNQYNSDLEGRLTFTEVHPNDQSFPYDYLVWPMHLVQRGYAIPEYWHSHIVHIVMGGNTIYCFIMARNPTLLQNFS